MKVEGWSSVFRHMSAGNSKAELSCLQLFHLPPQIATRRKFAARQYFTTNDCCATLVHNIETV